MVIKRISTSRIVHGPNTLCCRFLLAIIGADSSPGSSWQIDNSFDPVLSGFVRLACLALIVAGCGISPIDRRTFQTSDGVTLSVLEAGREHARQSGLTIALVTGWSMPAAIWR